MLFIMLIFVFINFQGGAYTSYNGLALFLSAVFTSLFIMLAKPDKHDYYFSGLLDGMFLLQSLLVLLL